MTEDFSPKNLIEWLETKPADKDYDWMLAGRCLLGQWCGSKGMRGAERRKKSISLSDEDFFYRVALCAPYTFGHALRRARDLALPSEERQ